MGIDERDSESLFPTAISLIINRPKNNVLSL